jgi:hypothetical protein
MFLKIIIWLAAKFGYQFPTINQIKKLQRPEVKQITILTRGEEIGNIILQREAIRILALDSKNYNTAPIGSKWIKRDSKVSETVVAHHNLKHTSRPLIGLTDTAEWLDVLVKDYAEVDAPKSKLIASEAYKEVISLRKNISSQIAKVEKDRDILYYILRDLENYREATVIEKEIKKVAFSTHTINKVLRIKSLIERYWGSDYE